MGEPITGVSGAAGATPEQHAEAAALADPGRTAALARIGLTAAPDPDMDAVADRVRRWLRVPVALVSLVEPGRQVFPGSAGLPQPWATARCTPLSHSFCRHVVTSGAPLVITDARAHELTAGSPAVTELGVVAYAGMPLTDQDGHVLGSLCAIDTQPHEWTPDELDVLRDLAWGCSLQLRLRLAEHAAATERGRRDELDAVLRRSHEPQPHAVGGLAGLHRHRLGAGHPGPGGRAGEQRPGARPTWAWCWSDRTGWCTGSAMRPSRSGSPSARAGTGSAGRTRHCPRRRPCAASGCRPTPTARSSPPTTRPPCRPTCATSACTRWWWRRCPAMRNRWAPWCWAGTGPTAPIPLELLSIATIAGYAAQALVRAGRLQNRIAVVHELQRAMLTDLPTVAGLDWAARYQPADVRDNVGGDWFDAIELPAAPDAERAVMVTVGDVVGHNVTASTVMGQIRSMLRQAAWMLADTTPSRLIARVRGRRGRARARRRGHGGAGPAEPRSPPRGVVADAVDERRAPPAGRDLPRGCRPGARRARRHVRLRRPARVAPPRPHRRPPTRHDRAALHRRAGRAQRPGHRHRHRAPHLGVRRPRRSATARAGGHPRRPPRHADRPTTWSPSPSASSPRSRDGLRRGHGLGQHVGVLQTSIEPFWPGRRAHAFDQFCR